VSTTVCGSNASCGSFFTQFPFGQNLNLSTQWNYTISSGLNTFYLAQPITVNQGNFIQIVMSNGSKLAIDTSTNNTFSDMAWQGTIWADLNPVSNYRFYFKTLNYFTSYVNSFSIQHKYANIGLYSLSLTFLSSNLTFQQLVNITDCKILYLLILTIILI